MVVLANIITVVSLAVVGISLVGFMWKFTIKVLTGKWENRGVMLAASVRKIAKVFCLFLATAMLVALLAYFFMALEWGSEHYLILLICFLIAVVSYPVISGTVLFAAELYAARIEAQIKAGECAEKIYNYMLKKNGEEVEGPADTDGMISLKAIRSFVSLKNRNQHNGWFCTQCGKNNNGNSGFCNNCGNSRK